MAAGGTGAAINFLSAGPNLQIVALGDTFQDRVDSCREAIKKQKGQDVPVDKCFVGFDAYQKVIDAGVDIVILATPPFFRPDHLAAAIQAKKHVFAEKPVCVDPVGARVSDGHSSESKGHGVMYRYRNTAPSSARLCRYMAAGSSGFNRRSSRR